MIEDKTRVRRSTDTASRIIGSEAIILTPLDGKLVTLNGTGARIWELIAETQQVDRIADTLRAEYEVTPDIAAADVRAFLEDMLQRGMIALETADA